MELTCGDSNSLSRKPSIPIGVFWYLLPYSHYAQATGSGRKLSTGTDPALPSLAISLGLGTGQVPLQGSRRAHPRLGLAPSETAIPGSGSGKRREGNRERHRATRGPGVHALSLGIAPGDKEAWPRPGRAPLSLGPLLPWRCSRG